MFAVEFKNEKDLNITLKNINFEILNLLASNTEFFNSVSKEKYYMYVEYEKIMFDKYTFLITKNNKKCIEMIYLAE
jgi:hypothetical protein